MICCCNACSARRDRLQRVLCIVGAVIVAFWIVVLLCLVATS